jgi:hypothetical protein
MKFTTTAIAAAILHNDGVESSSSLSREDGLVKGMNINNNRQQQQQFFMDVENNNNNNKIRSYGQHQRQEQLRLHNQRRMIQQRRLENSPTSRVNLGQGRKLKQQECAPDLGVLACGGLHEYCVTSTSSTMGGYCIDFSPRSEEEGLVDVSTNNRFLQDPEEELLEKEEVDENGEVNNINNNNTGIYHGGNYSHCVTTCYGGGGYVPYIPRTRFEQAYDSYCNTTKDRPDYYYNYRTCSCTNVDRDSYTLSATCSSEEQCSETWSRCNVNYTSCSESSNSIDFTGEVGSFSTSWCNGRSGSSICYLADIVDNYTQVGCGIEVNGVMCNSCEVVEQLYDGHCKYASPDPFYNCTNITIQCNVFDCTNTDWNRAGSTCDPYEYGNSFFSFSYGCDTDCNVCGAAGENAEMTLPDAMLEIPFYGKIQCNQSQTRASNGALTTDGCTVMQQLAFEPCGCE